MPSRFVVVDDPLMGFRETARMALETSIELGDSCGAAAAEALQIGTNVTVVAIRWIDDVVVLSSRVVLFVALCVLVARWIALRCIARSLVRGHFGLVSSAPKDSKGSKSL